MTLHHQTRRVGLLAQHLDEFLTAQRGQGPVDHADLHRRPYTPPMSLLRGLRAALDLLLAEGMETVYARHHHLAEGVRRAVHAWRLTVCARDPATNSDTVTAIVVPDGHDAREVIARAYDRYGISFGAGLSVLSGRVFRIGHLGDLNEAMLLMAPRCAEMAMRDVGIPIVAGSGVAAE